MIKPDLSKWEYKEELEGLLVFAQALEEMLFHHTIDTYKANALNARTNLLELLFLSNQLKNNKVRVGTIEPVIDELEAKFKQDLVIKPKYNSVFSHYFKRIQRLKAKPEELVTLLNALLSELNNFYWKDLFSHIEEKVSDPNRKLDIITLANMFITEAEFQGFSRGFIYYKIQGFFFKPDIFPKKIESPKQIKEFLESFNQKASDWLVIFRGSNAFNNIAEFAKYLSYPDLNITVSAEIPNEVPDETRKNYKILREKRPSLPLYISVDIGKNNGISEPISAREMSKTSIDTLSDIYSFVTHQEQANISDDALTMNKGTGEINVLHPVPNPMICGVQRREKDSTKFEIELFIDILKRKHFDPPSSRLIINSLDFHRAAVEAKTPENQLLDLWAALEGFLPTPSSESARVTHYVKAVIPSLTLTYPEKIFQYVADSIFHGGGKCRDIVESVDIDGDFFRKAAALITCDDLRDTREILYGELSKHLLLRNRIYEIHESFKAKKCIKNTILLHRERVTWHIQRIYTTRNQIIHNAESLPYLRTLVENLHSYLDILIETTSAVALKSKTRISIASALEILMVHEQIYLNSLEGDDVECTTKNFSSLIFGDNNPINPFKGISFY